MPIELHTCHSGSLSSRLRGLSEGFGDFRWAWFGKVVATEQCLALTAGFHGSQPLLQLSKQRVITLAHSPADHHWVNQRLRADGDATLQLVSRNRSYGLRLRTERLRPWPAVPGQPPAKLGIHVNQSEQGHWLGSSLRTGPSIWESTSPL